MKKIKISFVATLGALLALLTGSAQIIPPGGGTASRSYYTNRLLTTIASSGVTNRIWFTNAAAPFAAFGNTNAIHIRTNATTGKWEWRTAWATLVATNDVNRPTGTWHAATTGAALYGYTRYEPLAATLPPASSAPPSTALNSAFAQVDGAGNVTSPTNFWEVAAPIIAGIVETNSAQSAGTATTATTSTNWTGNNLTNLFGYWTPRHQNLLNLQATEFAFANRKPYRLLHIRDDAINSDSQLLEGLESFLFQNGSPSSGDFPKLYWYLKTGTTASSQSANSSETLWKGPLTYFPDGGSMTNSIYGSPLTKGVPFANRIGFVYYSSNNFGTLTIRTNVVGGAIGTFATVEGSHDRISDVPVLAPEPIFATSGGAGSFPYSGSAEYRFEVFAYKLVGATQIFSQNAGVIAGLSPAGSFYIRLGWQATDGATGYRVVVTDPGFGAAGDYYFDTTATSVNIGENGSLGEVTLVGGVPVMEYASGNTVTPKSAVRATGNLLPVGVVLNTPGTLTNAIFSITSTGGSNILCSAGVTHSTLPGQFSKDVYGGGGGGWGIDTCFNSTTTSNTFRELMKVAQWDAIFINDLGDPGRYLERTRTMLNELGLTTDIIVTTSIGTTARSLAARDEIYTNTSGAVVIDTLPMVDSYDPRLMASYYTNGNTNPDGVHTQPFVKTNVMRMVINTLGLNYDGLGKRYGYPEPWKTNYISFPLETARDASGALTLVHLYDNFPAGSPFRLYRSWAKLNAATAYGAAWTWPVSSAMFGERTNIWFRGLALTTNVVSLNYLTGITGFKIGEPATSVSPVADQSSFTIGTSGSTNLNWTPWIKIGPRSADPWAGWFSFGSGSMAPAYAFYWVGFQVRVDPDTKP